MKRYFNWGNKMAIRIDFGIHEVAVKVRSERAKHIANNIANADTPGFKARDIDLASVMNKDSATNMRVSHPEHISSMNFGSIYGELKYRNPHQPSVDDNTVDTMIEKSLYAENMQRFNASVNFLNGRISNMIKAFRGD